MRSRFLLPCAAVVSSSLLGLLASGAQGCAGPRLRATGIEIARGVRFDLLPPAGLGRPLALEQIVDARYGERSFSFHCLLEADARELVLVALTPFGTRAFALTLREGRLELETDAVQDLPAPPARILADLEIALWRDLGVLPGLDVVERTDTSGRRVRELLRGGVPVIRVTYQGAERWQGRLVFEHLEQGYTLDVRTLRAEPLAP